MGLARSNFHCHLLLPAALPCSLCCSGNRKTAVCGTCHFTRTELGTCPDADYRIRKFHSESQTGDSTKDPYDKPFYHKFASVLGVLIRKKAVTLVSMVILFIISLIIMGTMPQNFFPSLDKPYFRADVFYPDGYSINDVVKEMKSVEEHLAKQPEVKKVSITFGSTPLRYYLASTSVGPKPNFANVLVELTDSKYTKEYEEDFDGYMKANYPSAITRTSLFKLSPAVDAAIEIGFIGPNVDTLVSLTNQAIAIMHQNPDLINIRNSWGNKIPVWKPVYSPERAQPLGVSRQGMAQSIQIGTTGMTLGEYRQGDQVLPILLKNNPAGFIPESMICAHCPYSGQATRRPAWNR